MRGSKILPRITRPWRRSFERRHAPPVADYQSYRPCLRWEFGFSCAFCLCHEVDLMLGGVEGWAVTQIEHFYPKSKRADLRNSYSNCFYICRRCNTARGITENMGDHGGKLLNPCRTGWRRHFKIVHGEFRFLPSDVHAKYTVESYNLNDPVKVRLRNVRMREIGKRVRFLRRTRKFESVLHQKLQLKADGGVTSDLLLLIDMAEEIRKERKVAREELLKFHPIPRDRDRKCSCGHVNNHTLPPVLEEQVIDLEELL